MNSIVESINTLDSTVTGNYTETNQKINTLTGSVDDLRTQIASPFTFKGTVATVSSLPSSGNTMNDTYFVEDQNCLYSWNGTAWSQSSYDADGYAQDLADLKSAFDDNINYYLPVIHGWIENIYIQNSGENEGEPSSSNYYDATDFIRIIPGLGKLTITTGSTSWFGRGYNAWYDKEKNFISSFSYGNDTSVTLTPPDNAEYFRLSRGKDGTTAVQLSISTDYDSETVADWIVRFYQENTDEQASINGLIKAMVAEYRIDNRLAFDANGTYNSPNARLSINVESGVISISDNAFGSSVHLELKNPVSTIPNPASATRFITLRANHEYKLRTIPVSGSFTGLDNNIYCAISSGGQSADLIVAASGAEKTISYSSDTNVSLYVYVKYETTATVVFQYVLEDVTTNDNGDYIIGSDLRKRTVNVSPRLGILSGAQAFCMYNGKYYSFNNADNKIYVQDASFANVSNHDVSIGHGNALQLGSSHYAYASGWDDNTVYKVDLDTVTVVDTISLPTNDGTTTCVVDDVNEIVYIFHRTTSPYTEGPYTFIAYDYANSTELYRRKTSPCAALQGCDLVNGTIITVSGLGTSGYPDLTNYYRLFNTSGDVIGEYKIPSFASREPEGVFIDRTTYDVYFDIEKSVYKVPSLDS